MEEQEDILDTVSDGTKFRRALYSYTAVREHELNFRVGDMIGVIAESDSGWWAGFIGDRQGLFPINYTEEAPGRGPRRLVRPKSALVLRSVKMSPGTALDQTGQGVTKFRRALYDYQAVREHELDFCVGDMIGVIAESDSGWWAGFNGDREGLFPINYTEDASGPAEGNGAAAGSAVISSPTAVPRNEGKKMSATTAQPVVTRDQAEDGTRRASVTVMQKSDTQVSDELAAKFQRRRATETAIGNGGAPLIRVQPESAAPTLTNDKKVYRSSVGPASPLAASAVPTAAPTQEMSAKPEGPRRSSTLVTPKQDGGNNESKEGEMDVFVCLTVNGVAVEEAAHMTFTDDILFSVGAIKSSLKLHFDVIGSVPDDSITLSYKEQTDHGTHVIPITSVMQFKRLLQRTADRATVSDPLLSLFVKTEQPRLVKAGSSLSAQLLPERCRAHFVVDYVISSTSDQPYRIVAATKVSGHQPVVLKFHVARADYVREKEAIAKFCGDKEKPVVFLDSALDADMCLVLERGSHTLADAITDPSATQLQSPHARKALLQRVLECLSALTKAGFVHGDLKPHNVMLFGLHWKLIDLDAVAAVGSSLSCKRTLEYCPPEMAADARHWRDVKAKASLDCWCLGVMVLQIFTGCTLRELLSKSEDQWLPALADEKQVSDAVVENLVRTMPQLSESGTRDFVLGLLKRDPNMRLTPAQALKSRYFSALSTTQVKLLSTFGKEIAQLAQSVGAVDGKVATLLNEMRSQFANVNSTVALQCGTLMNVISAMRQEIQEGSQSVQDLLQQHSATSALVARIDHDLAVMQVVDVDKLATTAGSLSEADRKEMRAALLQGEQQLRNVTQFLGQEQRTNLSSQLADVKRMLEPATSKAPLRQSLSVNGQGDLKEILEQLRGLPELLQVTRQNHALLEELHKGLREGVEQRVTETKAMLNALKQLDTSNRSDIRSMSTRLDELKTQIASVHSSNTTEHKALFDQIVETQAQAAQAFAGMTRQLDTVTTLSRQSLDAANLVVVVGLQLFGKKGDTEQSLIWEKKQGQQTVLEAFDVKDTWKMKLVVDVCGKTAMPFKSINACWLSNFRSTVAKSVTEEFRFDGSGDQPSRSTLLPISTLAKNTLVNVAERRLYTVSEEVSATRLLECANIHKLRGDTIIAAKLSMLFEDSSGKPRQCDHQVYFCMYDNPGWERAYRQVMSNIPNWVKTTVKGVVFLIQLI